MKPTKLFRAWIFSPSWTKLVKWGKEPGSQTVWFKSPGFSTPLFVLSLLLILAGGCSTAPRNRSSSATPLSTTAAPKKRVSQAKTYMPADVPASPWKTEGQKWLGTPYKYGGESRAGTDCSGFAMQMYRIVAQYSLPRTAKTQFKVGTSVPKLAIKPGDLVFFNIDGSGASHVGVALDSTRFIHGSSARGVVISSLSEIYYNRAYIGARRILQ